MIINKCCKSIQYLYTFCYELFLSSGMDVCVGSWTKSLSRMKKIRDVAFVGPLSQRRIWKNVSGAPTWVPNPIYSTQTSLVLFAFCLVPTLVLVPLHWREKMNKKCFGWETMKFCSYGGPWKRQKYNPPEWNSI